MRNHLFSPDQEETYFEAHFADAQTILKSFIYFKYSIFVKRRITFDLFCQHGTIIHEKMSRECAIKENSYCTGLFAVKF